MLLLVVAALGGCGGSAGPASPSNAAGSGAPSAASPPGPTRSASPTPSPDPAAQAAKEYLALAARVGSEIASVGTLSASASLAVVKDFYNRLARIQAELLAGIEAISFPPGVKAEVDTLVRAATALQKVDASIATSASAAQLKTRLAGLAPAVAAMNVAANGLRDALGLPPSPTPSPRPNPTPTPGPAIDPSAGLRIGPPYRLEPMEQALLDRFETLLETAPDTAAYSYRFGARWITRVGRRVAYAMVVEVAGATPTTALLDKLAKVMAAQYSGLVTPGSILGHDVRLLNEAGLAFVLYGREEGFVFVVGMSGSIADNPVAIATELIRTQP